MLWEILLCHRDILRSVLPITKVLLPHLQFPLSLCCFKRVQVTRWTLIIAILQEDIFIGSLVSWSITSKLEVSLSQLSLGVLVELNGRRYVWGKWCWGSLLAINHLLALPCGVTNSEVSLLDFLSNLFILLGFIRLNFNVPKMLMREWLFRELYNIQWYLLALFADHDWHLLTSLFPKLKWALVISFLVSMRFSFGIKMPLTCSFGIVCLNGEDFFNNIRKNNLLIY